MASWHQDGCRRPDVFVNTDNIPTCLYCGSFFSRDENEGTEILRNDPVAAHDSVRLRLDWPSADLFSSVNHVNDSAVTAILRTLDGDSDESSELELEKKAVPDTGNGTVIEDAQGSKSNCRQRRGHENVDRDTIYHILTKKDEIRLLYLEPYDKEDQVLQGELRIVGLSDRPDYTALSYTWADASGDRSLCEKVFLGQAWMPLAITSNCAAALRRLRFKGTQRILWVDAICIDQGSIREKNHQVSLMRDIYSHAKSVIIFLGEGSGTNTPAARLMQCLSDERFRAGKAVVKEWDDVYDPWGVTDLFQQPYWSRIWVIQEVMLAASATLIFGDASLSFQEFVNNFARRLEITHGSDRLVKSQLAPWIFFDGVSRLGDPAPFFDLLTMTSTCKAEDPRDKVFALLGLVPGAQWKGLVADYSKTTSEIFTGLAAYFLLHGQSSILDAAAAASSIRERQGVSARGSNIHLLSWVPFGHVLSSNEHRDSMRLCLRGLLGREQSKRGQPTIGLDLKPTGLSTNPEPRGVFKIIHRSGVLLIRALAGVPLSTMGSGLQARQEAFLSTSTPEGGGELWRLEARNTRVQWTIHVLSHSTITFKDDWIIDVPGCGTFLHIRPSQRAPGIYELASPSSIVLTVMRPLMPRLLLEYLKAYGSGESSHWTDDYRLWMPLISFELQHLRFLRTLESMNCLYSTTTPSSVFEDELLQSDLDEYALWMAPGPPYSSGVYPGNEIWAVKKISIYLERWQDLRLWSRIHRIVFDIPWGEFLARLARVRAVVWSRLMSGDSTERIFDDLEPRLQHLFRNVVENLAGTAFITMTTHALTNFSSLGFDRGLMTTIRDIPSHWSIDQIRKEEAMIFSGWNETKECWEFMQQSKHECDAVRIKFFQLHVLKHLHSRKHLEFLIS